MMRRLTNLLVIVGVTSALGVGVGTASAQAAGKVFNGTGEAFPSKAATDESSTLCSAWSTSISYMRYRVCLVATYKPEAHGAFVRTGLQVINATHTPRSVGVDAKTFVDGVLASKTHCDTTVRPGNSAVATCWDTMRFVSSGRLAQGEGRLKDNSQQRTGSPVRSPAYQVP